MKATASILIDKPVSAVWDFVADVSNMEVWVNGVSALARTSEGEFGVGSTFKSDYTYAGKTHAVTYVITEFDPPNRITMRSTSGPFPFEGSTELREEAEGTRVFNTIDVRPTNAFLTLWFAILGAVLRLMMRRQLSKELVALKSRLEGSDTGEQED